MLWSSQREAITRDRGRPWSAASAPAGALQRLPWANIWIYLLADFAGGVAAAYTFLYVLPAEKPRGDLEPAGTG